MLYKVVEISVQGRIDKIRGNGMKNEKFVRSNGFRALLFVAGIMMIKFRHVIADAAWFRQNVSAQDVAAALNDHPEMIDEVNKDGLTGLMYAVNAGYKDVAEVFMERGAALDMLAKNEAQKDNERMYRNTALHFAVLNSDDQKNYDLAKALISGVESNGKKLNQKANIFIQNGHGFTPVHTAEASIENPERRFGMIVMLMEAAGNQEVQDGLLNAQNNSGNTILHIMAQKNDMGLIEKLINKYGRMLKFDIKNKKGQTAAMLAKDSGYGYCAARLQKMQEYYNDRLITEDKYKEIKFSEIPYREEDIPR